MIGDPRFTLWMTLISTAGGGEVTLAGVLIALEHGRRQQATDAALGLERDRRAAHQEELKHRRYQLRDWQRAVSS
jgi:hypothetical protein